MQKNPLAAGVFGLGRLLRVFVRPAELDLSPRLLSMLGHGHPLQVRHLVPAATHQRFAVVNLPAWTSAIGPTTPRAIFVRSVPKLLIFLLTVSTTLEVLSFALIENSRLLLILIRAFPYSCRAVNRAGIVQACD
jgi:hypothetical protein